MKKNFIFIGQLFDQGLNVIFLLDTCKVTHGTTLITNGNKLISLYIFKTHGEVGATMVIEDNKADLWHQRLGHISKKGLHVMHTRNQLSGLKLVDLAFCEHCLYDKQKRVSFLKGGRDRKRTLLDLV